MNGNFFIFLDRMKYISRWGLMRSAIPENVAEHSLQTAMLSHALAVIGVEMFGKDLNVDRIAAAAMYHDCSEILTGDMPTPVKYQNQGLREAYKAVELDAKERICDMLPEKLSECYRSYVCFEELSPEQYLYIKAADKLSAYIKCVYEEGAGNTDYKSAKEGLYISLTELSKKLPELEWFIQNVLPGYGMTVDELTRR
ncbi:MAG: 5'-deoxynucleotidase [Clostridia bacterium]|nr:5'-deoxynucleotidase [Clostridia bacterium]